MERIQRLFRPRDNTLPEYIEALSTQGAKNFRPLVIKTFRGLRIMLRRNPDKRIPKWARVLEDQTIRVSPESPIENEFAGLRITRGGDIINQKGQKLEGRKYIYACTSTAALWEDFFQKPKE